MESINDPWEVKASKSTELKDGSYIAEFIGVEDFSHDRIDGLRWKWSFKVVTGIELGKMADALTALHKYMQTSILLQLNLTRILFFCSRLKQEIKSQT